MANEVVKNEQGAVAKKTTLKDMVKSPAFMESIQGFFMEKANRERFVQSAVNAMVKTPMLAQCDKASFFGSLMQLAQFGLNPDGRNAHLIPFRNNKRGIVECQLIIDYKGLVTLTLRCPRVSKVEAFEVCKGDTFRVVNGEVQHEVDDPFGDRGEIIGYYAVCTFSDGVKKYEVMSKKEVDAVRARSRAASSGPWVTDYNEMAKKTVFKRLSKWLPVTPELTAAIQKDDEEYDAKPTVGKFDRTGRVLASDLLKGKKDGEGDGEVIDIPDDPNDDAGPVGGGENDK